MSWVRSFFLFSTGCEALLRTLLFLAYTKLLVSNVSTGDYNAPAVRDGYGRSAGRINNLRLATCALEKTTER